VIFRTGTEKNNKDKGLEDVQLHGMKIRVYMLNTKGGLHTCAKVISKHCNIVILNIVIISKHCKIKIIEM
jgi:hypothetical protein